MTFSQDDDFLLFCVLYKWSRLWKTEKLGIHNIFGQKEDGTSKIFSVGSKILAPKKKEPFTKKLP